MLYLVGYCHSMDCNGVFADATVSSVLKLADEYQVQGCLMRCDEFLAAKCDSRTDLSANKLVSLLVTGDTYDLHTLMKQAIPNAAKMKLATLERVPDFQKVSVSTQHNIFYRRLQGIEAGIGMMMAQRCPVLSTYVNAGNKYTTASTFCTECTKPVKSYFEK
jgi:hypothetical protein